MKKAKLGDVFCTKVPNGYKIYQWAYSIPHKGDYIRVFDGLYNAIPEDIERIVASPHSYIIYFYVSRAYRIGLAQFLGNYAVPDQYPFPKYQIHFSFDQVSRKVNGIHVMNADGKQDVWKWYDVSCMKNLPTEYQDCTLLNDSVTPNWLLYLFDNGFDLLHPERFNLGSDPVGRLQQYTDIVELKMNEAKKQRKT